tara:strand:+ start:22133 stop:22648 length:516 start_codon:yes stop_codon:yes gene_type:complete
MLRFIFLLSLLSFAAGGSANASSDKKAEAQAYLDRYVGTWKGELSIESSGKILRTLPLAAEYWKSGDAVKGLTAFEVDGEMTFVESSNYFRNGLLFADVTQKGETVTYRGFLKENRLVWIPYDAELNTERQMKERFVEEDGEEILYVDGVELLRSNGGTAKILLRARMVRE